MELPVHASCLQLGSPVGLAVGVPGDRQPAERGGGQKWVQGRGKETALSPPPTPPGPGSGAGAQPQPWQEGCGGGSRALPAHPAHHCPPSSPVPEEQTATAVAKEARRLFQGLPTTAKKKAEMSHIAMAQDSRASRGEAGM